MASYTPNLNLTLPIGAEKVSRQIINTNMTLIDTAVGGKVNVSDIVNNLTTNDPSKPLSAAQGYALNSNLSNIGKVVNNGNLAGGCLYSVTLQETSIAYSHCTVVLDLTNASSVFATVYTQNWQNNSYISLLSFSLSSGTLTITSQLLIRITVAGVVEVDPQSTIWSLERIRLIK